MPDQIRACNVTPGAFRRRQTNTRLSKRFCRENQVLRNDAVLQDFLRVIDVVNEKIQCMSALAQTTIDLNPFVRRNNSRDDVEWKYLLRTGFIAIYIEGNTHAQQCLFGRLLIPPDFLIANRTDPLEQ
jgi:hypothetical protein